MHGACVTVDPMKKTLSVLTLSAALGSAVLLSGCGGSKPATPNSSVSSVRAEIQSSADTLPVTPVLPSYPVGPADSTLRVWTSAATFGDITVSSPIGLDNGILRATVTVKATQGPASYISEFSSSDASGVRKDQLNPWAVYKAGLTDGALDSVSSFVSGEVRTGYVYFQTLNISKIYLGADSGTKAAWTVK